MNTGSTLVIIPARSGSKSIKDKNIQLVGSKSLLQHSIDFAKNLIGIERILVSTDSPVYASIARKHGAWVPFLRPIELSQDQSRDLEVMRHAVVWTLENIGLHVNTVVWVRPSYPFRDADFVNKELLEFKEENTSCSARTIRAAGESPFKMWVEGSNSELKRIVGSIADDLHNAPRQSLPSVFWQDGYVDFYNSCYINGTECNHSVLIKGLKTPTENLVPDIDHKSDFDKVIKISNEVHDIKFRKIEQTERNEYSS